MCEVLADGVPERDARVTKLPPWVKTIRTCTLVSQDAPWSHITIILLHSWGAVSM